MTATRALMAIGLSLWLAGCASSGPAPTQYLLPGDDAATLAGADAAHRLVVAPPRLARFLDVDGLVLQLDDITLNAANHHQWAEPLARQLERGLRARLAARLPETRILSDSADSRRRNVPSLHLEVTGFHGRYDGQAVTQGQWQLRDAEGELQAEARFSVDVALAEDGYPALVRALGTSWDRVSDAIATHIKRLR